MAPSRLRQIAGLLLLGGVLVAAPRLQPLAAELGARAVIALGQGSLQPLASLGQPPVPALEQPLATLDQGLLHQLSQADRQWTPTVQPLPGGGLRYLYKRRAGDPPLSLAQLRAQVANPPRFDRERRAVVTLLGALQQRGVRLLLTQPRKPGAAGEWDPGRATIRILPEVVGKGSVDFARVLNHEVIHVAQSCHGGGLRASPKRLGLPDQPPPALARHLLAPAYAGAPAREIALEREAYANQHRLDLGPRLLQTFCPLQGG